MKPEEIEAKSFEIIESELTQKLDPTLAPIIKRVIHTTADFDYETSMAFSETVVDSAR
ncbi:MAG: precorrin-8X methylmutase, partial [Oscillospiraceae bacterium]|nr:precorrin-8X methylmutase [Oscillospiraceae bacterium]